MIRTVFLGYGAYGAASLSGLVDGGCAPQVVVTHDVGDTNPVANLARKWGLPLDCAGRRTLPDLRGRLQAAAPDYLVSTNWRYPIPEDLLAIPGRAAINVHDSLLPDYAGLSAERWVIREGVRQTGVTVHLMTAEVDTGPIVVQWPVPVYESDTAASVARRQLDIYPAIVVDAIARLATDGFRARTIDPARYRRYHQIRDRDRRIDWHTSPAGLLRMIRAHDPPDPGCYFIWNERRFIVRDACCSVASLCGEPGRVAMRGTDGVGVVTGPTNGGGVAPRGIILRLIDDADGRRCRPSDVIPLNAHLT